MARLFRRKDHAQAGLGLEALEPRALLSAAGGDQALLDWGVTSTRSSAPVSFEPITGTSSGGGGVSLAGADAQSLIGLDRFRADARFSGIDGAGSSVVVLDTGADLNHSWFGPDSDNDGVADSILYHYDFAMQDNNASDPNGHGSNVASIIASRNGSFPGVAPGVNLIILKVFRDNLGGSFSYIEQALQWVIANADTYNIAAVNMSLSDQVNHTQERQLYGVSDELAALASMNIINVAASGNQFYAYGGLQGVGYPAVDPSVISVGAVYDRDEGGPKSYTGSSTAYTTGPDRLTPFGQRHSTLLDVLAPGGLTTGANGGGGTNAISGTSQATPHITGVAILLQQLAQQAIGRKLTVGEFAGLVRDTAVLVFDGDDEDDNVVNTNAWYRRMDVFAAAEALLAMVQTNARPTFTSLGTISGGNQGQSLTISYDQILALSNAQDPDGDEVIFRFNAPASGTITKNGVDLTPAGGSVRAGESLVWTPGEGVFGPTTAVSLIAWDGSLYSSSFVPLIVDVNAAPTLGSVDAIPGAAAGVPMTLGFGDIVSDAADAYGGGLKFIIAGVVSGSLTLNGQSVEGGEVFDDGDTLVWTPGADDAGEVGAFRVRSFDGVLQSEQAVTVRVLVNGRPGFAALPAFGGAVAGSPWTLTYDDLDREAEVIDPENDAVWFEIVDLLAGTLRNGSGDLLVSGSRVGSGDTIVWTPGLSLLGRVGVATVRVWDGQTYSAQTLTLRVDVAEAAAGGGGGGGQDGGNGGGGEDPVGGGGGSDGGTGGEGEAHTSVVGVGDSAGGKWFVRRDALGAVTLFERTGEEWRRVDLTRLAGGGVGEDVAVWVDGTTGRLTVALITAQDGLVLLERDEQGAWSSSPMAGLATGGRAIASDLVRLVATGGRVTLAGMTGEGELVLYQQEAIGQDGRWVWSFRSVTEDLAANGREMPSLSGRLIGFVTPWNAHNLAALNDAGEILAFWWSPGRERWALTNLSANTGAPALSGGLTAYLTPWGGVNIGGIDASGSLVFTWWVPAFGAQWRTTDLTSAVGGPRLTSAGVSAFVTPWGALNVAGFREDGSMVVYWWAPGQARWSVAAIGAQMQGAPTIARAVTGVSSRSGEISVAGLDEDGGLVRYFWRPGSTWAYETLDLSAVDLGAA